MRLLTRYLCRIRASLRQESCYCSLALTHKPFILQCTSDLWSGDAAAGASTFNFAFRGSHIVPATITSLITNHRLGATDGQRMLFGGCSAGAIGAMNNSESPGLLLCALCVVLTLLAFRS